MDTKKKIHNIIASMVLAPEMRKAKNEFMIGVRGYLRTKPEDDELFIKAEKAARAAIEKTLLGQCVTESLSVEEKMALAKSLLESIRVSGYWPFASPAPCSTEVKIKNGLNAALLHLDSAMYYHEQMFPGTGRDEMKSPSSVIEELTR